MSIDMFPQAIQIFPNDRQIFSVRAKDLVPLWSGVGGVVRVNGSVAQSIAGGGATQTTTAAESALQLMGAGSFEFLIENNCLPVISGGIFLWKAYFGSPGDPNHWIYSVELNPSQIIIRDETFAILTTLARTVGIGDRVRTELNSGFRLFINDILAHERTAGFAAGIQGPAFFSDLQVTVPSGTGRTPVIPAPLLKGDWRLRPRNRSNNPIVVFATPSHGSTNVSDLQAEYFNATIPGAYQLAAKIDTGIEIWLEDGLPAGATLIGTPSGSWVNSPPPVPISGNLELRIPNAAGNHNYVFSGAAATFQINQGDVLTCYVYLDAVTPPQEIVLEWKATDATGFEHRAYWGANLIANGTNGTPSRRFMGALPATGVWTRLEVPASLVDLEGRVLNGGSFYLFDGRCEFDQFGKYPSLQSTSATTTIPPLQIFGDTVVTLQPGQIIRFQTNYDVANNPPTWSVVSGGGSFSNGVFTAPIAPGTTVVRATAATGNQVADILVNIPAIITPSFAFVGPLETIDWDTNIPALPTFIAAGTFAEGTGNITPGPPAGIQANDILLLFVETANETVSAPAGWSAVADSPQGTGTVGGATSTALTVFWRRATANESAPTITDPGDHVVAQIHAFRGCIDTGNPWDVTSGNTGGSSTAVSIPGDTTTLPNCLVVLAVANATDTATPQASGYVNTDLANLTERADINTAQGNGGGFAVITGEKVVAGAYAATTATLATASVQGRISIALKPAPIVWTVSTGTINSSTGNWTSPSLTGQTVRITVSNGTFTAIRDVLILDLFPLNNPTLPVSWDRNLTALISMSEDRSSRITREKAPAYDSYPVKFTERSLTESNSVDAFFDAHGFGKRFILEDKLRGIRKVGWFDSIIHHDGYDECVIDLSFQFLEARL